MTAGTSIKERIVRLMKDSEGSHMTTAEIAESLELSKQQVHNAMSVLIRDMSPYIRRAGSSVYVYTSQGAATGTLFEKVGEVAGRTIVKDGQGNLFHLEELEVK